MSTIHQQPSSARSHGQISSFQQATVRVITRSSHDRSAIEAVILQRGRLTSGGLGEGGSERQAMRREMPASEKSPGAIWVLDFYWSIEQNFGFHFDTVADNKFLYT
jgi:hypothetical protein